MKRLGKVLHLSRGGNLILRLESPAAPSTGTHVWNHRIEKVGVVNNIIGPARAPYVSVQPSVKDAGKLAGRVLYQLDKE